MSHNLSKSRSLPSLHENSSHDCLRFTAASESSGEVFVNRSNDDQQDSGLGEGDTIIRGLEIKIDKLNELYEEQCRLLADIKDEMRCSKEDPEGVGGSLVMKLLLRAVQLNCSEVPEEDSVTEEGNERARSLLDGLQIKRGFSLDREIAQALVDYLQSEELRSQMRSATVEVVRDAIQDSLSGQMSRAYLNTLQRCHRRLVTHVTKVVQDAFVKLEEHTMSYWSSLQRSSVWVRRALYRHESFLRYQWSQGIRHSVQRILEKELQQWRQRALETVVSVDDDEDLPEECDAAPASPPPVDPETSIIDQMMMTAEIKKLIQDGDVNGAFEKALSAIDLSLVMTVCRAVSPGRVFAPICRMSSPVLLSLMQQLSTDMVHDTQLKCRYLEEALISLTNTTAAAPPHAHRLMVMVDMRKNLTDFLAKYPNHVAYRRVLLIVMASENLLK